MNDSKRSTIDSSVLTRPYSVTLVDRITPLRGRGRRGFTLVELLVVIFIMLLITAITIPVIAPAMSNREVREAARMVDSFVNGARTRALLAGHPVGVVLERQQNNPSACTTLSYCEQPDPYAGDYQLSTIRLLGNGGFGAWAAFPVFGAYAVSPATTDPVFKLYDVGWPNSVSPGDLIYFNGDTSTPFRIWAGEPFIDINQDGQWESGEPFADVDGDGVCMSARNAPVDPLTGYFTSIPSPPVWGTPSAFITYMYADPVKAAQTMNSTGRFYVQPPLPASAFNGQPIWFGPGTTGTPPNATPNPATLPVTQYNANGPIINAAKGGPSFSIVRHPLKTSGPSLQLPEGAVIDLGSNYPDQQFSTIVPIPGSGMEVLVANQNNSGWWSSFRAQPSLDPSLPGSLPTLQPNNPLYQPPDRTSIMITFSPSGTLDKVYSWSESQMYGPNLQYTPNWGDWQGRIANTPIYLLIGKPELVNGDTTLLPLMEQNVAPLKPIYNVQDPNALWIGINPQSGQVSTAENIGFPLTTPIPQNANWTGQNAMQMQIYWAANVYYSRRLVREMLDMGGR
jgi:prepilin-type N-terminal cleavage/methylation domain-containing protein